ncbi:ATP-binding protein [Streptomyces tendae]
MKLYNHSDPVPAAKPTSARQAAIHPPHRPMTEAAALPLRLTSPSYSSSPRPQEGVTASAVVTLPNAGSSVAEARSYVEHVLNTWKVREDAAEAARLLVSEVVGNCAVHADSPGGVDVAVWHYGTVVVVQVRDSDPQLPVARAAALDDECGRGLLLVEAVAHAWGVEVDSQGKSVWFSLSA